MKKKSIEFFTADQLAGRWGITTGTLANWRNSNTGPAYIKLGASVRYHLSDITEYEKQNTKGDLCQTSKE
jgi:predicted DNA-binding transcriptional regulator AlpA